MDCGDKTPYLALSQDQIQKLDQVLQSDQAKQLFQEAERKILEEQFATKDAALDPDVMTEDSIPSTLDEGIGYPELVNYGLTQVLINSNSQGLLSAHEETAMDVDIIMMDHSYCANMTSAKISEEDDKELSFGETSTKFPPACGPTPPEQILASPPRRSRRQIEKSESNEALEQSKEIERIKAFLDSEDSVITIFSKMDKQITKKQNINEKDSFLDNIKLEEDSPIKQKRKPGRPPKTDSPKLKESPKKRGRKKKDSLSSQEGEENNLEKEPFISSSPVSEFIQADPPKKKRGRKPKNQILPQEKMLTPQDINKTKNSVTSSPIPDSISSEKSTMKNIINKKTSRKTSVTFSSDLDATEPPLFSQPDVLIKVNSSHESRLDSGKKTRPNVTVEPVDAVPLPTHKKESPLSLLEALDDDYNDDSSDSELPFSQESSLSMKSIIGLKPTLSEKAKDKLKHLQMKFSKTVKKESSPSEQTEQEEVKEKRKRKASIKVREMSSPSPSPDEDSDDESNLSEDDPNRLWCICRKPYDDRFMIQCDRCEDWFHGSCVKINKQKSRQIEKDNLEWLCPYCTGAMKRTSSPPLSKVSKTDSYEEPSDKKGFSSPSKKRSNSKFKEFSKKDFQRQTSPTKHKSSNDRTNKKECSPLKESFSEKKRRNNQESNREKKELPSSPLKEMLADKKSKDKIWYF